MVSRAGIEPANQRSKRCSLSTSLTGHGIRSESRTRGFLLRREACNSVTLIGRMEPIAGIEPAPDAYKTPAIPLCYTGLEPKRGIEPRSDRYDGPVLPLYYSGLEPLQGVEPCLESYQDPSLPINLKRQMGQPASIRLWDNPAVLLDYTIL